MFRNFFKKKAATENTQANLHVAAPKIDLEKTELSESISVQDGRFAPDGTPLAWLVRPNDGVNPSGIGKFAQQIVDDGVAESISNSVQREMTTNPELIDFTLQWKHIYAAGNFRLWVMQTFGNSDEAFGKVGALCAMGLKLRMAEVFGVEFRPLGDEGLIYELDLDIDYPVLFGQVDGPHTLILMTSDDAHLYRLFDVSGLELPPPSFESGGELSLDKF